MKPDLQPSAYQCKRDAALGRLREALAELEEANRQYDIAIMYEKEDCDSRSEDLGLGKRGILRDLAEKFIAEHVAWPMTTRLVEALVLFGRQVWRVATRDEVVGRTAARS